MTNQKNSPISRRTLLRSGGAVVASGVVLAACGGSTGNTVTRIGDQPASQPLADVKIDDVVLLRTAQSVEKMVADILSDTRITSLLSGENATIVAAFAAAHQRHVSDIAPLVTSRGAESVNEPNAKLMTAYGNTVLDLMRKAQINRMCSQHFSDSKHWSQQRISIQCRLLLSPLCVQT